MFQVVRGVDLTSPQRNAEAWRDALIKAAKHVGTEDLDAIIAYEHALVLRVLENPGYLVNPFDLHNMALAMAYCQKRDLPRAVHDVSYPLEGEQSRYGDSALIAVALRLNDPFIDHYKHAVRADTAFGRRLLVETLPHIYGAYGAVLGPEQAIIKNSVAAVEVLSNAQVN